jgi:hypothetical protein
MTMRAGKRRTPQTFLRENYARSSVWISQAVLFSTFYGKPSTWMDTFSATKKKLVGIRIANERGYHPSNVG